MTVRAFQLDGDNNLVRVAGRLQRVADGASVVQAIRVALQRFKGEWFLNVEDGMPYFEDILVKNPNLGQVHRRFVDHIESVAGVDRVETLTLNLNSETRELFVTFEALLDLGELVTDTLTLEIA